MISRLLPGVVACWLAVVHGVPVACAGPQEACDYSARMDAVSCLVMVDGRIVHEAYSGAGAVDKAWGLASGTKSFSGVAAAAAAQDGLFRLDDKVADILTEWRNDGRKEVTIRQLLSLTSGIRTPRPGLGSLRIDYDKAIALPLEHAPGTHYAYGQAPFQVFAAMVERRLNGEKYLAYLRRRYLDALGITLEMRRPPAGGDPSFGGGGIMTARDWAKFGEFVRQGGKWNGRQLVDATALTDNFTGSRVHAGYREINVRQGVRPCGLARSRSRRSGSAGAFISPGQARSSRQASKGTRQEPGLSDTNYRRDAAGSSERPTLARWPRCSQEARFDCVTLKLRTLRPDHQRKDHRDGRPDRPAACTQQHPDSGAAGTRLERVHIVRAHLGAVESRPSAARLRTARRWPSGNERRVRRTSPSLWRIRADLRARARTSFESNWADAPLTWPVPTFWTIRLTPIYEGTQVEIFHHGFERLGAAAADNLEGYEQGRDIKHLAALRAIVEK